MRKAMCCLVLLWMALLQDVYGDPVSTEQAGAAVTGWLQVDPRPLQAKLGQPTKRVESFKDSSGMILYHVVYLDPEGFVVVAADDLIEPIIAFVPTGTYDASTDHPLGALVINDLAGRQAQALDRVTLPMQAEASVAREKWARLQYAAETGRLPDSMLAAGLSSVTDLRVAPLLQTVWNQTTAGGNACYNYYTPPNAEGFVSNYYSGCVGTALAQLMRFWQHPVASVATTSFPITVDGVPQTRSLRGGNGAGGPYVWSEMVADPESGSTLSQRQAIGALCADAGTSVNMEYSGTGSSASMLKPKDALVSTFGYGNAVKGYNSGSTLGAGLHAMVNPNLDAGGPVLLGLRGGTDGHAIICDGYGYDLSTLYHHLNMGWGGYGDAWYNLPAVDAGGYSFTSVESCVYNVWTNGNGEILSGRVADGSGNAITGALMTAVRSGGGAFSATSDVHGIYAFTRLPTSSTYTVSATRSGYVFTNLVVTLGRSVDYAASSGNRWAVNFAPSDGYDPAGFSVAYVTNSRIDLVWGKNPFNEDVMVAWNTTTSFGMPAGSYTAGAPIAGGGTVLYNGGATGVSHVGLTEGVAYYYRAWSVRPGPAYSSGVVCSATTPRQIVLREDFEHGGAIAAGWTQEYVTQTASWVFQSGGRFGRPSAAHGGSYNALLYAEATSDHKTRLITPMITFGAAVQSAQLRFWHCMTEWPTDQDELRVFYKTSSTGAWVLVETYAENVALWTQRTVALPNPSSTYYVAFEGNARYGYGVCIDDVVVESASSGSVVPDAWKVQYFGTTSGVGTGDFDDYDQDGFSNYGEYRAGTDPTNAYSLLKMEYATRLTNSSLLVLEWQSVTGRTFSLLSRTNMLTPWSSTSFTGIPGRIPRTVCTVDVSGVKGYWRVKVD